LAANGIVVALLGLGNVAATVARSQDIRGTLLPGSSVSAIPFVGNCARCALSAGDVRAARRHLAQLFEMCRAVNWTYFVFFGNLYPRLPLAEGRADRPELRRPGSLGRASMSGLPWRLRSSACVHPQEPL
jgi:hypothetical protein